MAHTAAYVKRAIPGLAHDARVSVSLTRDSAVWLMLLSIEKVHFYHNTLGLPCQLFLDFEQILTRSQITISFTEISHATCPAAYVYICYRVSRNWRLCNISSFSDIDECVEPGASNCDQNALCTNTEGSYACRCLNGYDGDGKTCQGRYEQQFRTGSILRGTSGCILCSLCTILVPVFNFI